MLGVYGRPTRGATPFTPAGVATPVVLTGVSGGKGYTLGMVAPAVMPVYWSASPVPITNSPVRVKAFPRSVLSTTGMIGSRMLPATAQPVRGIGGAGSGAYGSTLNERTRPDTPMAAASAPVPPLPELVIAFQWLMDRRTPPSPSGSPESR